MSDCLCCLLPDVCGYWHRWELSSYSLDSGGPKLLVLWEMIWPKDCQKELMLLALGDTPVSNPVVELAVNLKMAC